MTAPPKLPKFISKSVLIITEMAEWVCKILSKYGEIRPTASVYANGEEGYYSVIVTFSKGVYYIRALVLECVKVQLFTDTDVVLYSGNKVIGRGYINNDLRSNEIIESI